MPIYIQNSIPADYLEQHPEGIFYCRACPGLYIIRTWTQLLPRRPSLLRGSQSGRSCQGYFGHVIVQTPRGPPLGGAVGVCQKEASHSGTVSAGPSARASFGLLAPAHRQKQGVAGAANPAASSSQSNCHFVINVYAAHALFFFFFLFFSSFFIFFPPPHEMWSGARRHLK